MNIVVSGIIRDPVEVKGSSIPQKSQIGMNVHRTETGSIDFSMNNEELSVELWVGS